MNSDDYVRNALDADGVSTGEIRRISHSASTYHGWRMEVCPGKRRFIRFFADEDYGSDSAALRAARMARAALLMEEWR